MIRPLGVQARVVIAAVLPMLVIAFLLTAYYTSAQFADIQEAHTSRARALARQVAAASEYAVFSGDRNALQSAANAAIAEDGILAIAVVDRLGEALALSERHNHKLIETSPLITATDLGEDGAILRIIEPIVPSNVSLDDPLSRIAIGAQTRPRGQGILGNVIIDLSQAPVHSKRAELQRNGALAVMIALIGALALAIKMSRGVSGPIRQVAQTVDHIGQGHFEERVPMLGGGSLRLLADGVNRMASELADSHRKMNQRIDNATAELRARKEEAERANLAKSRFLAAASHDLRQPMHALSLFIASLAEHRLHPRSAHLVGQIYASAEAMEQLLDSLLDISRLDAGGLQPRIQAVEIQGIFDRVLASLQHAASENGVSLIVRPTKAWVESDPALLERILANLVGNAIRYSPDRRVLLACRRRKAHWRIEIRDNGIGIPEAAHEAIFEEFVQLDNPERAHEKGLGLGLAIVARLSKILDHSVVLRSSPGKGAVFAIEARMATAYGKGQALRTADRLPGDLRGLHVVIIDDDDPSLARLVDLLRSWACRTSSGANLQAAITAVSMQGQAPQILLCTCKLQDGTTGTALIDSLRQRYGIELPAALIRNEAAQTEPAPAVSDAQTAQDNPPLPLLQQPIRPAKLRALLNRANANQH